MAEQVEVLKSGFVSVHKFDFQPSGLDDPVTERQIHHAGHPFPLAVRLPVLRYQAEVFQPLHDIAVPDIGIRHLAVSPYLGMPVRLRTIRTAVRPDPASAQGEQRSLAARLPFVHAVGKTAVVQIALVFAYFLAQAFHGRMDFAFGYLKPRQYVLAGHQHKRTLQPHVVGIQSVSFRLVVCRESAALDTIQFTQPAAQAAVEVLGLHPVQDVDTGLPVLRGRNGYKVLPERVFRVAHQHALIACLRLHPAKLAYRDQYTAGYHRSHLHPVCF